jgi:hypothetical protein
VQAPSNNRLQRTALRAAADAETLGRQPISGVEWVVVNVAQS